MQNKSPLLREPAGLQRPSDTTRGSGGNFMAEVGEAAGGVPLDVGLRQVLQEALAQIQPPHTIRENLLKQATRSSC
jgi:hypothetical protein